jgi:hypothetical protein
MKPVETRRHSGFIKRGYRGVEFVEETAMWTLMIIAAASSIALALIACGSAIWHDSGQNQGQI